MYYYGDGVAVEDLINNSFCVKFADEIRNIKSPEDVKSKHIVFVSNIDPYGVDSKYITIGHSVRYTLTNVSFR